MMKDEFEKLIGKTVSDDDYDIIENVYTWHPSIGNVNGKQQIASIYQQFGMPVIIGMNEAAEYAKKLNSEKLKLEAQLRDIAKRLETVAAGNLEEERCRKDAEDLFTKRQSHSEWQVALDYMENKYDKMLVNKIRKERKQWLIERTTG